MNTKIPLHSIGTVHLSFDLVLNDLLFVHQFKFNLLLVSSLTSKSSLRVKFFTDSCIIQDLHTLKMVGRDNWTEGLYVIEANFDPVHFPKIAKHSFLSIINNVTDRI